MSYEFRTYDADNGDPVVVLVATGPHDVSRVVQALTHGNCEQMSIGMKIVRSLKRHNKGRFALALLKAHGGTDFTDPDDQALVLAIADRQGIPREYVG